MWLIRQENRRLNQRFLNVRVALGFHPELVKQRHFEKDLFFEQMKSVCFLGEIGIDGSRRAMESLSEQIAFFDEVIHKASINNRKVLSIHSRGAVKEVLQTLESNNGNYVPVLHWFTGKIKEAEKASEQAAGSVLIPRCVLLKQEKKSSSVFHLIGYSRRRMLHLYKSMELLICHGIRQSHHIWLEKTDWSLIT